jgi:hypothetical protein
VSKKTDYLREQAARLAKDCVQGSASDALTALAAKSERATMSDHSPIFRMMVIARKAGWYGYIIGRYDEPGWMQRSLESFSSIEAADKAGRRAMEIISRKISEPPHGERTQK